MAGNLFKRTTFIVPDAEAAAAFYTSVFGWSVYYDNELPVDHRFPPAAPDGAMARLIILDTAGGDLGRFGLLQYLDPPFDTVIETNRSKVRMGEPIMVIDCQDVDRVYQRAESNGANVVSPPTDWEVPSADGKGTIKLRIMSMFDPWGHYMEIARMGG